MRHIELVVLGVCSFICFMVVFTKFDQESYDRVKEDDGSTK